jgi:K+-transporting ATPase c subunit
MGEANMRTTLNLDDQLLISAKHRALDENVPLSQVVENALRAALLKPKKDKGPVSFSLITVSGSGLKPGVDLDSMRSLLDVMDDLS